MIDIVKKFFGKMTKNGSAWAIGIIESVSIPSDLSVCPPSRYL